MGYEVKLFVVEKSDIGFAQLKDQTNCNDKSWKWGSVVSSFDLCKVSVLSNSTTPKESKTDIAFFSGNDVVTEDCYGDDLTEYSIEEVVDILKEYRDRLEKEENYHYRRLDPCIKMLESFLDEKKKGYWDNHLVVLTYGH